MDARPNAPAVLHSRLLDQVRRRHVAYMVLVQPLLAIVVAAFVLPRRVPGGPELVAALVLYVASAVGIGAGYHRLITHKAAKAHPAVVAGLAILGAFAGQGPVTYWAALHRMHHANSDGEADPHSPHARFEGRPWRGFFHAHLGWMFVHPIPNPARWTPEMVRNPVLAWVSRTYPLWFLVGQLLPALAVGLVTQSAIGALSGWLWGGLVRTIAVQHVIWSINSVCHLVGDAPYASGDGSRNVWWLALPSCGEAWHNNHHAQPTTARHGWTAAQVDISGALLGLLHRLGLLTDLRAPNPRLLLRLRAERLLALGERDGAIRALRQAFELALAEDQRVAAVDILQALLELDPAQKDLLARLPRETTAALPDLGLTLAEARQDEAEADDDPLEGLPIRRLLSEDGALERLLPLARRVRFAPGEAICRRGDPADAIWILTRGTARVELEPPVFLQEGDVLGESAIFPGEIRSADVVAHTNASALRLDAEALREACATLPALRARTLDLAVRRRLANHIQSTHPELDADARVALSRGFRPLEVDAESPIPEAPHRILLVGRVAAEDGTSWVAPATLPSARPLTAAAAALVAIPS